MRKLLVLLGLFIHCITSPISLLLVDTQGKDGYCYRNIELMAQAVGFTTDYKSLYALLENPDLTSYDAVFFMISPTMLMMSQTQRGFNALSATLPRESVSIAHQCLNALYEYAQQSGKGVGIILPGLAQYSEPLKRFTYAFVDAMTDMKHCSSDIKNVVHEFLAHILEPVQNRGSLFGTSLINPNPLSSYEPSKKYAISTDTNNLAVITTPIDYKPDNILIQQCMPIGLLIKQHEKNNQFLISKLSEFDFADIGENFFKNPLSLSARNTLLQLAQNTLHAWHDAIAQTKIPYCQPPEIPLPHNLQIHNLAQQKQLIVKKRTLAPSYEWMNGKKISCAWMDPYDFFGSQDDIGKIKAEVAGSFGQSISALELKKKIEQTALQRGIEVVYDASFDILWFEFVPELYLSMQGTKRIERQEYIQRIETLARELRVYFAEKNKPLPKIFIGLNLTSNFRSNFVRNPVCDMNGTVYSKIPCPFDVRNFWLPEVLNTFKSFQAIFQRHMKIDGIFFDFEMYHAPEQTGAYTDTMDFSDMSWQVYCLYSKNTQAVCLKTVKERVAYLQDEKKFTQYFTVLEKASKDLGMALRKTIRSHAPTILFAAYAPTLPTSWFYRGMYAGLSTPSEPLLLATFNTDFASHNAWLKQHGIHVLHASALMLSKFNKPEDFNLINNVLMHHDFVWYNRPSRMVYEYTQKELEKVWWGMEATATNRKQAMYGINHQHIVFPIMSAVPNSVRKQ